MAEVADRVDWKMVSRELVDQFTEFGSACVDMRGEVPSFMEMDIEPLTPDDDLYGTKEDLTPKRVRGWLWARRKAAWMPEVPDDETVLFASLVEGLIVVGLGTLVEPKS